LHVFHYFSANDIVIIVGNRLFCWHVS